MTYIRCDTVTSRGNLRVDSLLYRQSIRCSQIVSEHEP